MASIQRIVSTSLAKSFTGLRFGVKVDVRSRPASPIARRPWPGRSRSRLQFERAGTFLTRRRERRRARQGLHRDVADGVRRERATDARASGPRGGRSSLRVKPGLPVFVTSDGRLGVVGSSERYKTDIAPMGSVSERLLQLRPVTFRLKTYPSGDAQFGLIAEEVASVYPELVIR